MNDVTLNESDRTVFATCPTCCRKGRGVVFGDVFCMAYTVRQWSRKPACENCGTKMEKKYEVR